MDAARLRPESLAGWTRYVNVVEARRHREVAGNRFFVMDQGPGGPSERQALLRGETLIREMEARGADGRAVEVPGAMVHHWRGAVFLPGTSLTRLIETLATEAPPPGRDVLRSAVLKRSPGRMQVFLRLERTRFVTVVLDTEHDVQFVRESSSRASSSSIATRIVEVDNAGTALERARPAGDDRGFLWRLNAYWRYEAVAGGVLAECESVSLSRSVPFGFQTLAGPLIGSAARESMARALEELVDRSRRLATSHASGQREPQAGGPGA